MFVLHGFCSSGVGGTEQTLETHSGATQAGDPGIQAPGRPAQERQPDSSNLSWSPRTQLATHHSSGHPQPRAGPAALLCQPAAPSSPSTPRLSSVPPPRGGPRSPGCSALVLISCPRSACPQPHIPPGPPAPPGDPRWDPCQPLHTARDPTGLSLPWPPRRLPSGPSGINTGNRISEEGEAAPEKASAGRAGSEIPILEKQLASWIRDSLPGAA